MEPTPAFVMGLDAGGYGIAHALAAHAVPVVGFFRRGEPGRFSHQVRARPLPESTAGEERLEQLIYASSQWRERPALFASTDADAEWIQDHEPQLRPYFRYHWCAGRPPGLGGGETRDGDLSCAVLLSRSGDCLGSCVARLCRAGAQTLDSEDALTEALALLREAAYAGFASVILRPEPGSPSLQCVSSSSCLPRHSALFPRAGVDLAHLGFRDLVWGPLAATEAPRQRERVPWALGRAWWRSDDPMPFVSVFLSQGPSRFPTAKGSQ